ncbi:hypothetical protein ABVK25_007617 [Lepraria finkii]|uniref:Uncharacterized protein n=1 Tax=Lepraria finkii TaxID=1340010 RepID=A0ABR4B2N9_9LECA
MYSAEEIHGDTRAFSLFPSHHTFHSSILAFLNTLSSTVFSSALPSPNLRISIDISTNNDHPYSPSPFSQATERKEQCGTHLLLCTPTTDKPGK